MKTENTKYKDSGIPWIGMIPEDWTIEQIGRNIAEVDNPNSDCAESNALQFKAGTIISKSQGDSKYHPDTLAAYNIVEEGDIMLNGLNLSFDMISQRVGLVCERGVITSAYLAIRPNENINSEYLTYLFKAYDAKKALHSMGRGLRQTLSYKELKRYSVVFPPLPTQQRIADFLDKKCSEIDELAALQETMIAELKRYKQSVITEAVTKGLDPNVKMKDSGVEWIGEVPEGWEVKKIKQEFMIIAGATPKSDDAENWDGDIPWITPADYTTEQIYVYGGKRNLSPKGYDSCSTSLLPQGCLIFSKRAPIGLVAINAAQLCTNQGCLGCVPKDSVFTKFVYYTTSVWTEQFELYGSGTTFKEISANNFANFKLAFPPLAEQQAIADYLDRKCGEIDELIAIKQQKIEQLKEYKKSVIFEYVTGKKEVER